VRRAFVIHGADISNGNPLLVAEIYRSKFWTVIVRLRWDPLISEGNGAALTRWGARRLAKKWLRRPES
jgi:hypothetical protein